VEEASVKFLLIYPPSTPFFITSSRVFYGYSPPLGLLYIAEILEEHGDSVTVLDFSAEPFQEHVLMKALHGVDAVGISVISPSLHQAKHLIALMKQHDPELPVIIGGPHSTLLPEKSLQETQADMSVQGDGEASILHLRSALQGEKEPKDFPGIFFRTPEGIQHGPPASLIRDLNSLPFPARHLVKQYVYHSHEYNPRFKAGEFTSLVASRGCPYQCRFCSRGSVGMKQYRTRTIENVVSELQEISEQGYLHVAFVDDCFPVDIRQAHLLFKRIIDEQIDLRFSITATRVDLMDKALFGLMKQAGVAHIQFGLESGNQDVLDYYHKQTTVETIRNAVDLSHDTGFFTAGSFILGAPFETQDHFKRTLSFAKSLPLDSVSFIPLRYMVGSDLWNQAVGAGAIGADDYLVTADKNRGLGMFTKEELIAFCFNAQRAYYLRPRFFMKLLETSLRNNDMSHIQSFISVLFTSFSELFATGKNR
jgi:anaerobic magnesium-protoporphyrin IX monomethyl ester cyclase